MKKLMIALTAALSFGVYADEWGTDGTGLSFENHVVGDFDFTKLDNGEAQTTGGQNAYWITESVEDAQLLEASGRYDQSKAPDHWANELTNGKYLHLDGGLVYRTAKTCITSDNVRRTIAEQTADSGSQLSFKTSDVYFDSMVKFSAFEEMPTEMADTAAKLAVYAYAPEAGGYTNLCISGGYATESGNAFTNYLTDTAVDLTTWHRLTVRALNAGKSGASSKATFLVYLDDKLVTYDGECGLTADDVNATAAKYIGGDDNALIPSKYTDTVDYIVAMGLKGCGDVDDISISTDKPSFIHEDSSVTVTWDDNVASIKIDDGEIFNVTEAGDTNVTLAAGVTEVTVAATYKSGYERGNWNKNDTVAVEGNKFTDVAGGDELNVVSMFPKYAIGGVHYGSLEDAIAAASESTVKMIADDTLTAGISIGTEASKNFILDLAGKTLTGANGEIVITVGEYGKFAITNSTAELGEIVADEANAISVDQGTVNIYGGKISGAIAQDGGELTLFGGQFLDENYDPDDQESDFYLSENVADGVTYKLVSQDPYYFQVGEDAPPPAAGFTVTITQVENCTITAETNGQAIASGAVVASGTSVDVTRTPATGYNLDGYDVFETIVVSCGTNITAAVKPIAYVAQIGSTKYETFEEAVAEVGDGETIQMIGNYTNVSTEAVAMSGKGSVILDLNGYELVFDRSAAGGYGFAVSSGTALTLKDSSGVSGKIIKHGFATFITIDSTSSITFESGTAAITQSGSYSGNGGCFKNQGTLTISGGTINVMGESASSNDSTVKCYANSTTTINGGTFIGQAAIDGTPTVFSIPGTSKARFSVTTGYTGAVEDGYKLKMGEDGYYHVAAVESAELTITQVENCSIVVSNATAEVESGATFDVDDKTELTVYRTPASGYELDGYAATETITMTNDVTVTAAVKSAGGLKPGEQKTLDVDPSASPAEAQAEADKIVPQAFNDEAAAAGQAAVLKSVAVKVGDVWMVEAQIDESKIVSPSNTLEVVGSSENIAKLVSAPASGESTEIKLNNTQVTSGLYYSIGAQTSLDANAEVTEGTRELATSEGVSIKATKPNDATNKCFFKVLVNMTPKPAN